MKNVFLCVEKGKKTPLWFGLALREDKVIVATALPKNSRELVDRDLRTKLNRLNLNIAGYASCQELTEKLEALFEGLDANLPFSIEGISSFDHGVLRAILRIPKGFKRSQSIN